MPDVELIKDLQAAITRRLGFSTPVETLDFLALVRLQSVLDLRKDGVISDNQTAMNRLMEIHEAVALVRSTLVDSHMELQTAA